MTLAEPFAVVAGKSVLVLFQPLPYLPLRASAVRAVFAPSLFAAFRYFAEVAVKCKPFSHCSPSYSMVLSASHFNRNRKSSFDTLLAVSSPQTFKMISSCRCSGLFSKLIVHAVLTIFIALTFLSIFLPLQIICVWRSVTPRDKLAHWQGFYPVAENVPVRKSVRSALLVDCL